MYTFMPAAVLACYLCRPMLPWYPRWSDWDALAEGCGLDCFLVMPLHCANQDMGALLVTSASPVSLDKYGRKLAGDLGHALSQAVYTLACIGQMKASDRIIHDILPEKVRQGVDSCTVSTQLHVHGVSQPVVWLFALTEHAQRTYC